MKRAFLVGLSVVAFSAVQAGAADIPMKAVRAPIAAPAFSWTGCHVGGNIGWARAEHDLVTVVPATSNMNTAAIATITTAGQTSLDGNGWTGGGQIGCDWQTNFGILGGFLVLGAEGDLNWLGASVTRNTGIRTEPNFGHLYQSIDEIRTKWLGTIRGRVGLAFGPVLLYGTGGVAFAPFDITKDFRWDFTDGCPLVNTLQSCHVGGVSGTRTGWTAGGGIEWAFVPTRPGWSVKAEYLFSDFGSVTYTTLNRGTIFAPPTAAQPANHTVSTNLHVFRLGLNFLF